MASKATGGCARSGSLTEDETRDAAAAGPIYRNRKRQVYPANNQCHRSKCEQRAHVTFTDTYVSEKTGEEVERREPLCWDHYQQRRHGITPEAKPKSKSKPASKAPSFDPTDPKVLAAIAAFASR